MATAMAKRLIRLFGFLIHDAPGEAEAECALLQQNGIVDAVLSEDVDTIMFGCTRTLRNWSAEGTKGAKTPTHVSMYDSRELAQGASGLDREGMVLVALMSGGDYLPEGIPGAGVKLACEAAKAGFGKSLCQIKRANTSELTSWKERLTYELRHNESGFFRTRHKALTIPDDFPNMEILRYYTHPVVSPATTLDRLKGQTWDKSIDVQGLREFVRETFDWSYRIGAVKFIRVLAPCLLVRKIMQHSDVTSRESTTIVQDPSELVRAISTRRAHFSTDATPEIRVSFIPSDIVGYNFQEEPDEVIDFGRDGLALNSDNEMEDIAEEIGDADATSKSRPKKPFSPTEPDLLWIPETIARVGIPSMVDEWEEAQHAKAVARSKPKASRQKAKASVLAVGSLDKFVRVTKPNVPHTATAKQTPQPPVSLASSPVRVRPPLDPLPASSQSAQPLFTSSQEPQKSRSVRPSKLPTSQPSRSRRKPPGGPKADANTNPWTIANSQGSPRVTKSASSSKSSSTKAPEPILISSSPPSSPVKDISPPMNHTGGIRSTRNHSSIDSSSTQPPSPRKRRSLTPTIDESDDSNRGSLRDPSPTPSPAVKSQRKLARAESLPVDSSPRRPERRTIRGFTRAQTVAIEILPSDSEAEENHNNNNDDDEDDFELPPLSSLIPKLSKSNKIQELAIPSSPPSLSTKRTEMVLNQQKQDHNHNHKQTTLKESLKTTRMTKLYMPRKSQPGFFREIEVDADEADALKEEFIAAAATSSSSGGRRPGIWRRSDVSCIDLTGEDD